MPKAIGQAEQSIFTKTELYYAVFMNTTPTAISFAVIMLASLSLPTIFSSCYGQQLVQTIHKRDLTIELDTQQQIQTRAQVTVPAIGNGPFPAGAANPWLWCC